MTRRSLLKYLILNVLVTFITVFVVIAVWQLVTPQRSGPSTGSVPVVITKVVYQIVTPTLPPPTPTLVTTPSSADLTATAFNSANAPTLDPNLLPPNLGPTNTTISPGSSAGIVTVTPGGATESAATSATEGSGCPTYTVKKGDIPGNIAQTYGVSLADLMKANKMTERDLTRLQIGQVLIIPVNGCGLATEEPSATPTRFVAPTLPSTVTIAPTASTSEIEITQVISPGDITAEAIEIRNVSGDKIQMQGWTLTDVKSGNAFTFPEYLLFSDNLVRIFTKAGSNTPKALYWGKAQAVWTSPDQVIEFKDAKGNVQASRTVSGSAPAVTGSSSDSGELVPTETPGS